MQYGDDAMKSISTYYFEAKVARDENLYKATIIKTHISESRGQEEAAVRDE